MEKIFWTDEQPEPRGRQRECDMLKGNPGLQSNAAKAVKSPRDAFELFMSPGMVEIAVEATNARIESTIAELTKEHPLPDHMPYVKTTTDWEMYALFRLLYF